MTVTAHTEVFDVHVVQDGVIEVVTVGLDASPSGGGGGASNLVDLEDVDATDLASGTAPVYDGTDFVMVDVATQTELGAEATTRSNADSALDTRVDALESVDPLTEAEGNALYWPLTIDLATQAELNASLSYTSELQVNDVWTIDGVAGAPIDADAGMYQIQSNNMDGQRYPAIDVTVGDDTATIQATFNAALGSGNVVVAGDWDDLELTFLAPDGIGFSDNLLLNLHTLTKAGNPVADPTFTNTIVGHGASTVLAGLYRDVLGKATDEGLNGFPTMYDPDSQGWNERGYVKWSWDDQSVNDLMGFGPGDLIDVQRAAGWNINGWRYANTNVQAYSNTVNEAVVIYQETHIRPDGTSRSARVVIERDYEQVAELKVTDTDTKFTLKALPGQTEPILDLQDENGNPAFNVTADGAPLIFATTAPADADIANSSFALWLDDTPGTTALKVKAKDSAGTVRTATIPLT